MSSVSDYAEDLLLNYLLNTDSVTRPTSWYVSLWTTDPADDGSGTEVSGTGYTRQSVTFGTSSGGTSTNTNEVSWTGGLGGWGTITHFGLHDASTGGNLLWKGALDGSYTIDDGEIIKFEAGALAIILQ